MATHVAAQATTFSITDSKLYVPVLTLSTQAYTKLLEKSKSDFKITINWNKYQSGISPERSNQYLDYLVDPSFQRVNIRFVLSFGNETQRISCKRYYNPTIKIENYNVLIDGQNFFGQPVRNDLITYLFKKYSKIGTVQGDDYTTGSLLDYNYFRNYYQMITIGLNKQQALNADPKAIQQINFIGNLAWPATVFFIIEEAKEIVLDFSQGTVNVF